MTYRATNESSTQTPEERAAEANKILYALGLADMAERGDLLAHESKFVNKIRWELDAGATPSVKQLWWLRDIKEKYL